MRPATRHLAAMLGAMACLALPVTGWAQMPLAFSATAVQTMPDGSQQTGRVMKSGQNMRIEMQADGQSAIQIMRGADGVAYLIDPQSQTYAEIHDPSITSAVDGAITPCPGSGQTQAAQIRCEQTGEGEVSGITTQRWELQGSQDIGPTVIQWDTGRRRALSTEWPDGSSLKLTFQAMQTVAGRNVEYWASAFTTPNQPAVTGGWWFDPELLVVVREEMTGGVSRQLTDFVVGPIDPAAFLPPQGYTQVTPQTMSGQQQGAAVPANP